MLAVEATVGVLARKDAAGHHCKRLRVLQTQLLHAKNHQQTKEKTREKRGYRGFKIQGPRGACVSRGVACCCLRSVGGCDFRTEGCFFPSFLCKVSCRRVGAGVGSRRFKLSLRRELRIQGGVRVSKQALGFGGRERVPQCPALPRLGVSRRPATPRKRNSGASPARSTPRQPRSKPWNGPLGFASNPTRTRSMTASDSVAHATREPIPDLRAG
eukprot:1004000-Rhodomonas_salina.1